MKTHRITPTYIASLKSNEVFVFGSNQMGIHGKGAAKQALDFGARRGMGLGHHGQTYAIPTKGPTWRNTLPINTIQGYVDEFIAHAVTHPHHTFLVTAIGCGLAGYKPEDIAPLFKQAVNIENIYLPWEFWKVLNQKDESK